MRDGRKRLPAARLLLLSLIVTWTVPAVAPLLIHFADDVVDMGSFQQKSGDRIVLLQSTGAAYDYTQLISYRRWVGVDETDSPIASQTCMEAVKRHGISFSGLSTRQYVVYNLFEFGWPLRTHQCSMLVAKNGEIVTSGGILAANMPQAMRFVCYGVRPISFCATVVLCWSSLVIASLCARRTTAALRRARGLCIDCGYPIELKQGEACPECGRRNS